MYHGTVKHIMRFNYFLLKITGNSLNFAHKNKEYKNTRFNNSKGNMNEAWIESHEQNRSQKAGTQMNTGSGNAILA